MGPTKTPDKSREADAPSSRTELHLRILNLTDLHMEIRGYDYFADAPTSRASLRHAASLIERLKADVQNSLVFDNGDILQGNPMGDYAAQAIEKDPMFPHPMIAALNVLGIDAATLGNHEFNYGLAVLRAAFSQAHFPVVSANVLTERGLTPDADKTLMDPFVMLPRSFVDTKGNAHELCIGVLGLLPPQIVQWDRKHLENHIWTRDIVETARHFIPKLRAAGADLIVVLCHSGIEETRDISGLENAAVPVAALEDVDVVIAGHSHLVFPSTDFINLRNADIERGLINGKPVTLAGFSGSHVGCVDLVLSLQNGKWTPCDARAAAIAVDGGTPRQSGLDVDIMTITEAAHSGTLDYVRQPVGATDSALDSYLAMLEPSSVVQLVATAQAWRLRQILQDTPFADLPLLSAAAPFKMGGRSGPSNYTDVPSGAIAMRNVADLYSYPNVLRAVLIDGASLRDWLEYSAGIYAQIDEECTDQPLIDPAFPAFSFDSIAGVTYDIDLTQRARFTRDGNLINASHNRIRNLQWRSRPVADNMTFIVATNDYRVGAAGAHPVADDCEVVLAGHESHRDVLIRYLQATPGDRALMRPPWQLLPIAGASVVFETSPNVLRDRDRLKSHSVTPLSVTDAGFLMCRKELK